MDNQPLFENARVGTVDRHGASRRMIKRVASLQWLILMLLVIGAMLIHHAYAVSVMLGGLCSILPNIYCLYQSTRFSGAQSVRLVLRSFKQGQVGKFVLTMLMMAMVFVLYEAVEAEWFIGAYFLMLLVGSFAPFWLNRKLNAETV